MRNYTNPIRQRILGIRNGMISRCYNENNNSYKNYGGRGISVCDEWLNDREAFYAWALDKGYKEGLQIDRIDSNGNYCPENCRWVTSKQNNNNRRNNNHYEMNGEWHTLSEWSDLYNISYDKVRVRVNVLKWDLERALTTPVNSPTYVEIDGITDTIAGHCHRLGLCIGTVRQRLKYGYSIEEAFSKENFMENGNRTKRKIEKYGQYHVTFKENSGKSFKKVTQ